jgi:hypothetical protein
MFIMQKLFTERKQDNYGKQILYKAKWQPGGLARFKMTLF